jgi:hypothetical protein
VFVEPAAGWANAIQTAELTASDGRSSDYLGFSVGVSGNTVVAGAPYRQVGAHPSAGAVYVFVEPATGWANAVQTAELTASDGSSSDYLGLSTAISGDTITAGAPYHQVAGHTLQGAAYVFVEPAAGWANAVQTAELTASGGSSSDYLGLSAALSGETLVAGAPGQQVGADTTQGAAIAFGIPQPTSTSVSCAPNPLVVGESSTCTASTSASGGLRPDGGEVRFLHRGRTIPRCGALAVAVSSGKSACHTSYAIPGSELIQAVYAGDLHFAPSVSASVTQTVQSSVALRGSPSGGSGVVRFRLRCAARSRGCHVTGILTTIEKVRGKHRTLVVGKQTIRLGAAKTITTAVTLNAAGRRLLSRFKRLPVTLTLSLTADGQSSTITSRRVTVKP